MGGGGCAWSPRPPRLCLACGVCELLHPASPTLGGTSLTGRGTLERGPRTKRPPGRSLLGSAPLPPSGKDLNFPRSRYSDCGETRTESARPGCFAHPQPAESRAPGNPAGVRTRGWGGGVGAVRTVRWQPPPGEAGRPSAYTLSGLHSP